jgi:hypothetical protein
VIGPTKEQHQSREDFEKSATGTLEIVDKRSGKKACALHGNSELTETKKKKKARKMESKVKRMLKIVFDIKRIIHKGFVLSGQAVNSAYYYEVLQ